MPDIVYVLTHPSMPGLIKIGFTTRDDVRDRMNDLRSGVPGPFECFMARRVRNGRAVEKALHVAFAPDRVQSTEFFKTDPERVAVILRRLPGRDITPRPNTNKKRRRRPRPPLDFIKMGIPVGSTLVSLRTDETATVTGARKVMFRDEEMSLTAATRLMLGTEHNIIPTRYWKYESELLRQRYNAIYGPRRKN